MEQTNITSNPPTSTESTSDKQGLLDQAKEYVAETVEIVNQTIQNSTPEMLSQAKDYVTDKIADVSETIQNSTVSTTESGSQGLFSQTKTVLTSAIDSVKSVVGLGPVDTHDEAYLNDIAKSNWSSLSHVESKETDLKARLANESLAPIKKVDHKPLLNDIQSGAQLASVDTNDKSKPVIDKSLKIKKNVRKDLFNEVVSADIKTLKSVEMNDRSKPLIDPSITLDDISPPPTLLDQTKSFISDKYENAMSTITHPTLPGLPLPQIVQAKDFVSQTIHNNTPEVVTKAKDYVQEKIHDLSQTIQSNTPTVKDIMGGAQEVVNKISSKAPEIPYADSTKEYISDQVEVVVDKASTYPVVRNSLGYVSTKLEQVRGVVNSIADNIQENFDKAKEMVGMSQESQEETITPPGFLGEINEQNREMLKHVETVEKNEPVIAGDSLGSALIKDIENYHILNHVENRDTPVSSKTDPELLKEVKNYHILSHVDTVEKHQPVVISADKSLIGGGM